MEVGLELLGLEKIFCRIRMGAFDADHECLHIPVASLQLCQFFGLQKIQGQDRIQQPIVFVKAFLVERMALPGQIGKVLDVGADLPALPEEGDDGVADRFCPPHKNLLS